MPFLMDAIYKALMVVVTKLSQETMTDHSILVELKRTPLTWTEIPAAQPGIQELHQALNAWGETE